MPRAKRAQVTRMDPPAKPTTSTSAEPKNGKNGTVTTDLEHAIRLRAYELYVQRGRLDGYAQDDWLQAEAEVRLQMARTA